MQTQGCAVQATPHIYARAKDVWDASKRVSVNTQREQQTLPATRRGRKLPPPHGACVLA
jgi:hypothetical protein